MKHYFFNEDQIYLARLFPKKYQKCQKYQFNTLMIFMCLINILLLEKDTMIMTNLIKEGIYLRPINNFRCFIHVVNGGNYRSMQSDDVLENSREFDIQIWRQQKERKTLVLAWNLKVYTCDISNKVIPTQTRPHLLILYKDHLSL